MIKKAYAAEPMLCIQRAASLRSADAGAPDPGPDSAGGGCHHSAECTAMEVRPGLTSTLTRERGLRHTPDFLRESSPKVCSRIYQTCCVCLHACMHACSGTFPKPAAWCVCVFIYACSGTPPSPPKKEKGKKNRTRILRGRV